MKTQVKADLMLVLVTLFWGVSYLLIDISLTDLQTFNLNALRFLIAFLVAGVVSFPRLRSVNRETLKYAAILGIALLMVYIGCTYGIMYTSLSNAGFMCATTVVITPILGFFFKRQKPDKKLLIVLIMAFVGIALLSLNEQLKPALGDILCLMCAAAYAVHLLVTETAVKKEGVDAYQLGVFQLGFCGIYQLILSCLVETPHLPGSPKIWVAVLFLSVFCTGAAFVVQTIAQQYTSATHVGVIFSLEPVFAGLVAFFVAHEVLIPRAYVGAVLLISSLFIMELDVKKIFGRKKGPLTEQEDLLEQEPGREQPLGKS